MDQGHHLCQRCGLDADVRGFGNASFAETSRLLEKITDPALESSVKTGSKCYKRVRVQTVYAAHFHSSFV